MRFTIAQIVMSIKFVFVFLFVMPILIYINIVSHNNFWNYLTLILITIGGLCNFLAVVSNSWKMPVYSNYLDIKETELHKIYSSINKIKFPILIDKYTMLFQQGNNGVNVFVFSLGDLLCLIGFIIGMGVIFL